MFKSIPIYFSSVMTALVSNEEINDKVVHSFRTNDQFWVLKNGLIFWIIWRIPTKQLSFDSKPGIQSIEQKNIVFVVLGTDWWIVLIVSRALVSQLSVCLIVWTDTTAQNRMLGTDLID